MDESYTPSGWFQIDVFYDYDRHGFSHSIEEVNTKTNNKKIAKLLYFFLKFSCKEACLPNQEYFVGPKEETRAADATTSFLELWFRMRRSRPFPKGERVSFHIQAGENETEKT
jgi:hypothetical protein